MNADTLTALLVVGGFGGCGLWVWAALLTTTDQTEETR